MSTCHRGYYLSDSLGGKNQQAGGSCWDDCSSRLEHLEGTAPRINNSRPVQQQSVAHLGVNLKQQLLALGLQGLHDRGAD